MILCGDSAGGNLVLGVLSHLLHPHPSISPLELRQPFLGAAMVSPWGDFRTSAPSFLKNDYNDSIDAPTLRKWAAYFMNGADADNYNQPFRASDEWWSGLGGVVQSLLITAGTDEVLVDGIAAFAAKIRVRSVRTRTLHSAKTLTYTVFLQTIFPTTKTLLASQEYHDQPFMEPLDDGQQRSQQGKLLKAWVVSTMMQDGTKADGP